MSLLIFHISFSISLSIPLFSKLWKTLIRQAWSKAFSTSVIINLLDFPSFLLLSIIVCMMNIYSSGLSPFFPPPCSGVFLFQISDSILSLMILSNNFKTDVNEIPR